MFIQDRVNSSYEHALACVYHRISDRGLRMDTRGLSNLHRDLDIRINELLYNLSTAWGCHVYLGKDNDNGTDDSVNLNSSSGKKSLVNSLKRLGYDVPLVRKRVEREHKKVTEERESAGDESLQKIFAATGDINIKYLLEIRELNTLDTRYATAELYNDNWYSIYNVAGTETGRRGSKAHLFGFGGNAQNFPKHGSFGNWHERFRECIIARPGRLFFSVDQISAEEWPVQALAKNYHGLQELDESAKGTGASRHAKLASIIFGIPIERIDKSSMEYHLGKRGRHANNYGMRAPRFSAQCAAEGKQVTIEAAKVILEKINRADPQVDLVFHAYIKDTINKTRTLCNPFGRERIFFGLRPNDTNYEIFTKAFAYVPQSTVADNTGLAVLQLDSLNSWTVHENHDSITEEPPDELDPVIKVYHDFDKAFDREIKFDNGIAVKIPIEGELGYDFAHTVKVKDWSTDGVAAAYKKLKETYCNAAESKELVGQLC